ncbi:nuclease domain-containing protein [Paenibacillus sp. V4I5]
MCVRGTLYFETYRMLGPEEDDINTMHRYRDAEFTLLSKNLSGLASL